jgi:hypothetical protein
MAITPLSVATEGVIPRSNFGLGVLGWVSGLFSPVVEPVQRCEPSDLFPETIGLFALTGGTTTFKSLTVSTALISSLNSSETLLKTLSPSETSLISLDTNTEISKTLAGQSVQVEEMTSETTITKTLAQSSSTTSAPTVETVPAATPVIDPEPTLVSVPLVDEC